MQNVFRHPFDFKHPSMSIRSAAIAMLAISFLSTNHSNTGASEPGWSPVIIATGPYRDYIQSTPIQMRPYRPLHFYGNTVRRMRYRGTPFPTPLRRIAMARISSTTDPR